MLNRKKPYQRNVKRPWAAVLLVTFGFASSGLAEEPLVTDRPDFTESSSTVGSGVLQIEAGFTYAESPDGTDVTNAGEVLARWGVAKTFELRFVLPTYVRDSSANGDVTGFSDTGLGLKVELAQGEGKGLFGGLEAALIASTEIPTGSSVLSDESWQPSSVLALGWDLNSTLGLGANVGVASPVDEGQRFTSAWASVALGVGLTDAVSWFVELYAFNREELRGPDTAVFQTGFVYLLNLDFQLDVRAARRLTDQGVDLVAGAGLSWRLRG
jgi:hypothetical protein